MDFEDPKLRNILKLKEAFEKELIKMGKMKPRRKSSIAKPSTRLNIDIAPPATVNAADTWTVLDLNRQDYDASDASIVKALRQTMGKVKDIKQRTILDGILKFLQRDYQAAKEVFSRFDDDEYRYMLGLTKFYSRDPDSLNYAVNFLKERSTVFYPYILISEIMLGLGRYSDAERFFEAAAKVSRNVYLHLTLGIYREEQSYKKLFPIAVNKGGYKSLLAIMSIFMENNFEKAKKIADSLSKRENSCCRYISSFWGGIFKNEDFKRFSFCPRITLVKWAREFEEDKLEVNPEESGKWNDPLYYLFLAFYFLNIDDDKSADRYFEKFESSVRVKRSFVFRSGEAVGKVGMAIFYKPIDPEPLLDIPALKSDVVKEMLKEASEGNNINEKHLDVFVRFRDPEILRLFFGQRHCKNIYEL